VSTRWKLTLEYDGTAFVGWQVQPNGRSIQAVVEDALATLLQERVKVGASGRTDAGVHALGQTAAFTTSADRSRRSIVRGLNALLPSDVAVVDAVSVDPQFDARHWVRRKHYRYTWLDREGRSPLRKDRAWHVGRSLDHEAMHDAAQSLVGTHNFASFRAAGCSSKHPVRTVESMAVTRNGEEIYLDVWGNGFLRYMVRIVSGTLTEVGLGRRATTWVAAVRDAQDRHEAGRTAPAGGLTLIQVRYGNGPREIREP